MENQLELFDDAVMSSCSTIAKKQRLGGSQNPIVFHDYDSFIAKFTDKPKTTDECWTPPDVYDAVLEYVRTITDITGKQILRPFYPGGDYLNAEYPENGIVIDNPPFSIFSKIVKFYTKACIPFFLFGPGKTIMNIAKYCTCVFIGNGMRFTNGAITRINFASNLYGDTVATTAPLLDRLIRQCPSQNVKVNLPKYKYPPELVSFSDMHTICGGGKEFSLKRGECIIVRNLDNHPTKQLFGCHLLTTHANGVAKEETKKIAKEITKREAEKREMEREIAKEKEAILIELSEREMEMIGKL